TDVNPDAVSRVLAEHPAVTTADSTDALIRGDLDVYAPCALGGALDDATLDVLSAQIVCGSANNQLAHPGIEKMLVERHITYAHDYCVIAGVFIQVAAEHDGFSFERANSRATTIFDAPLGVLRRADADDVPPSTAGDS